MCEFVQAIKNFPIIQTEEMELSHVYPKRF